MVSCSHTNYKTFLVGCNVLLLIIGVTVLTLGIKMENAMYVLGLIHIPMIGKTIKAVIATGTFISLSGVTGICGACFEFLGLLMVHLVSLGVIVVMEFSLGVTLMIVKRESENALENADCNSICAASVDAVILDYALPSAGLMMTIIFVEALMIYFSIKLFFYIRDGSKTTGSARHPIVVQDIQMHGVSGSQSAYLAENLYSPQMVYMTSEARPDYVIPRFIHGAERYEAKPPDYNTLYSQHPPYLSPFEPFSTTANAIAKETDEVYGSI